MTGYRAGFVLRVQETHGSLRLSVHNLKTGQRKEFSTWKALWVWLEQQVKHEGLR